MTSTHPTRFRVLALAAVVGFSLFAVPDADAAKKLRWSLKAGDTFSIEMKQTSTQSTQAAGQNVDVKNDVTTSMTWTVDSIDGKGQMHMTQTMDRMQMTMTMPGQPKAEFDSNSDKASGLGEMIGKMIKPMIGQEIKVVMDERGKVVDFKMPKDALKGLQSNPLLESFLSEDTLKQMTTNGSPVFPEDAIDEGHKWSNEFTVKSPVGDMTTKAEYTYQGEESKDGRTLDKVGVSMTMQFGKAANPALGQIEITDQDSSGTTWFDAASGHFAGTDLKQDFTMKITSFGQTAEAKTTTTMKMTVKKIK